MRHNCGVKLDHGKDPCCLSEWPENEKGLTCIWKMISLMVFYEIKLVIDRSVTPPEVTIQR